MSQPARRFSLLALVTLVAGGLLGGLLGGRVQADPQRPDDQLNDFGRVLALVEDQYVGETDSREIVENAILGMLQTLDPHSNYLNPESFNEMRDEQRGKFSGLGIQITKRGPDKPLTIIAPIDDTPASRAGLRSGDVIAEIEGQPTIDLTVHEAVRLLKGEKGTRVTITIERPGTPEPFSVLIERDDIPIESIRVAHMLTDDVGFVRISNFTSTTAEELDRSIEQLSDEGMTRLIIDLRGNPGGLLEQAVQVSERFVPSGRLVVYTRGRIPGSNQDYVAKRGVERVDLPLVLLVDCASASASEILSGAVQDHDRGLIVGEPTFGKGLVQRVIPLQDGGALAVTTAKYYTPSGRLIQRDYTDLDEYYLRRMSPEPPLEAEAELTDRLENPKIEEPDIHYTASGRKVFGGGGIHPDYVVEAPEAPEILFRLIRENQVFNYAVRYLNEHPEIEPDFEVDDEVLVDFRRFLTAAAFEIEDEEFSEHSEVIALRLRAQIARVKWDQDEESRILAGADPQVQKALELFDEAAALNQRGALGRPGKEDPRLALQDEGSQAEL
jgi:carboxyl-terminal processing protease